MEGNTGEQPLVFYKLISTGDGDIAEQVYEAANSLSDIDQAKIISRLLGLPDSTSAGQPRSDIDKDRTIHQINLMNEEQIAALLEAIALRVKD